MRKMSIEEYSVRKAFWLSISFTPPIILLLIINLNILSIDVIPKWLVIIIALFSAIVFPANMIDMLAQFGFGEAWRGIRISDTKRKE